MNLDTWNRLPLHIKKQIEVAAKVARNNFRSEYLKWFDWYLNDQKSRGCTIVFANKKDIEYWNGLPEVARIREQWLAEATAAGANGVDHLLGKIVGIVNEGITRDQLP